MAVMLASDDANPQFMGATNPDAALHVRFYSRPIQNPFLTQKESTPIFEDVIFVEIHTPGNQLNVVDTPARDDHKRRFPLQWAHFQNTHGKGDGVVGTPLAQWPLVTAGQAETLKAMGFVTVQQVAFASDEQIQRVGMYAGMSPFSLRDRAKRFLEAAQGDAVLNRQAAELDAMKKQIEELTAMLKGQVPQGVMTASTAAQPAAAPQVDELAQLRAKYEQKFGKPPHHKMKAETMREKLAA